MFCYHCMKEILAESKSCPFCAGIPNQPNPQHLLAAGAVLFNRYVVGNTMSESGSVVTYAGLDSRSNNRVVIKEYYPSGHAERRNAASNTVIISAPQDENHFADGKNEFMRKAISLSRFSDEPHFVTILDYFIENNTAYMVTAFLDGSTLAQAIQKYGVFSPNNLIGKVLPLVQLLEKLHREDIIFRNISPDTIMVMPDGRFVLFGFDAACGFPDSTAKPYSAGRQSSYAPLELYIKGNRQGAWTDVYALCATVYESLTGVRPSEAPVRVAEDDLKRISDWGIDIAPHAEAAIMKGLAVLPKDRVQSMSELAEMLANTPGPASESLDSPLPKESDKSSRRRKIAVAACIAAATVLAAAGVTAAIAINRTPAPTAAADSTAAAVKEPTEASDAFAAEEAAPAGKELVISPEIEKASAQSRSFSLSSLYNILIVDENKQAHLYDLSDAVFSESADASSAEKDPITFTNNEDIVSAVRCCDYCYGLRTDGSICLLHENTDYKRADSGSWNNVSRLEAIGDDLLAVYKDGTVTSLQYKKAGNSLYRPYLSIIAKWSGVRDIMLDRFDLCALKADGTSATHTCQQSPVGIRIIPN